MKLKFTLTDSDLLLLPPVNGKVQSEPSWCLALKRQLGPHVLVSSGYMLANYEFPNSHVLQSMFYPTYFKYPPRQNQYEYEMVGPDCLPKVKLVFTPKDFTSYREFGNAVCKQMDKTATYISEYKRAYVSFFFDFPEALNELRRPSTSRIMSRIMNRNPSAMDKQYDFELESSVPGPKK